jgi:hypothetical protein
MSTELGLSRTEPCVNLVRSTLDTVVLRYLLVHIEEKLELQGLGAEVHAHEQDSVVSAA